MVRLVGCAALLLSVAVAWAEPLVPPDPKLRADLVAAEQAAPAAVRTLIDQVRGASLPDRLAAMLKLRAMGAEATGAALALTELLMQKAGRVVPKDSIVARMSTWEADFSENSVEVYVHRLRKRFADLGVVIRTVRGFGYLMEPAQGTPDGPAGA